MKRYNIKTDSKMDLFSRTWIQLKKNTSYDFLKNKMKKIKISLNSIIFAPLVQKLQND